MAGQHGQPHVAFGVGRLFLQNIQCHALGTGRQQQFDQVGQAGARPWPGMLGQAGLVDIDHQDAPFRLRARLQAQDLVAQFQSLGLYRAFVPEQFGGSGMDASTFLRLIEAISAADGSAGWVASFGFATKYLSSLPADTLAEVYRASPDVVFAGAVFPPQTANAEKGGYRVKGRWGFGSGSMCASLIGVGIKTDGEGGGLPRMAVMPRKQVRIEENWDVIGMFATGSHDLVVDDVFVPEHYTLVRGAAPSIDTAAYRYPSMAMAAL